MDGNICALLTMTTLCFLYVHGSELTISLNDAGFIIMIMVFGCAITQGCANVTLVTTDGSIEYLRMEANY